jgi:iron complex transport system ATP-binding protein
MIEARSVDVRLGAHLALSSVSVRLTPGRSVAIIGRNAAGKTTLLRTLAGLLEPDAGVVLWEGRPPSRWSARDRARSVAYVAQRSSLSERFSVAETVELGRYALAPAPQRVETALRAFGLETLARRPYHDLSVGQQQRVALARAWAQVDPTGVLLLDEPFAAMDLAETDRTLRLLDAHRSAGGTAVIVVHDLTLAASFADEAWLLEGGRLVAAETSDAIFLPERLAPHFGVPFERDARGRPVPIVGPGGGDVVFGAAPRSAGAADRSGGSDAGNR